MSHSILRSLVVAFVLAGVLSAASARAQTFSTPWMHATNQDWASEWGVLDPQILFAPGSWAQLKGATGNWDGVRSDLSNAGVSVFGSYESESAGNPVGGEVHKFRYTHNIALGVALDLHRLLGLERYLLPCVGVGTYRQQSVERHPQHSSGTADFRTSNDTTGGLGG